MSVLKNNEYKTGEDDGDVSYPHRSHMPHVPDKKIYFRSFNSGK